MVLKNVKEIMLLTCFLSSEWNIVESLLVHASKRILQAAENVEKKGNRINKGT